MDDVEVLEGVDGDGAEALCGWVNARGAAFLEQWAGPALSFPLTRGRVADLEGLHSIRCGGEFVGVVQWMSTDGGEAHIGRFIIDPARTGRGLGRRALEAFLRIVFADERVSTVSLSVYEDNAGARALYERMGFRVRGAREGARRALRMELARGGAEPRLPE